jgi:ankyrin repeat protein
MQAIDGPTEFDNDHHVVYSPRIAALLISAGADVTARDDAGDSALTLAIKRGYREMVVALQSAGANK